MESKLKVGEVSPIEVHTFSKRDLCYLT